MQPTKHPHSVIWRMKYFEGPLKYCFWGRNLDDTVAVSKGQKAPTSLLA
jgi:hypothetical protein